MLRYIALGQSLFVFALTIAILIRYAHRLRQAKSPHERILPLHILLIGLSYLGLTIGAIVELRMHLETEATWRVWNALLCFSAGDLALILMLMHLSFRRALVSAVLQHAREEVAEELQKQTKEIQQSVAAIEITTKDIQEKLANGGHS